MTEHPAHRGGAPGPRRPARTRLLALGQVLGDRRRANDRLRRSLWVSVFAHALLFLGLAPFALPRPALQAAAQPEPLQVERITELPELVQLSPEQLERMFPEPQQPLDDRLQERTDQEEPLEPERHERHERALAERQESEPPPPRDRPPQRLEFLRSHHDAADQAPDTHRISTQNQMSDRERVALARAQVADGRAERGTQAGAPQKAARHGAQPQQPTSGAPTARQQQSEEQARTTAQARAPQAREQRQDQRPCGPGHQAGPCDALADARDALDRQQLVGADARDRQEQSPRHASAREGWEPMAVRIPGVVDQARPFPEAPLPDRAASPGATAAHDAVLVAHPAPSTSKQAQDAAAQRKEQARAVQQARAQGSSQPEPSPDQERPAAKLEPPQPELEFLVEPLDLLRQEQEREQQQASSRQQNQRQRRRSAPPGSAKASAASAAGSEAAAGGSVVSPIDPPQAIDVRTVLSTRAHPLSGVLQALDDELREAWEIPFDVRVSGVVGTTGVELLLDRRGRVRDVVTTRPSGHALLDQAARQAIPSRIDDFTLLLEGEARDTFPADGLRVYYEFEYTDSPVAGVL